MKRPLALLAGSALVSLALAAPAGAVDVPPLPVDRLTFPIEQLTGVLGLDPDSSADNADEADGESRSHKVGATRGESGTRSDVRKAVPDQKINTYRAPRKLPKSGGADSTMLLALAGLALIAGGGYVYSAGKR